MRAIRLVLPLAILAGALFSADHSSGKQTNSKPSTKKTEAEQTISKKESRMNQRDREMDQRMKQKKAR